jgi:uncharacterized membrane protein
MEELAKGDHFYKIPALFPKNTEYQRLIDFQIPQNNRVIMLFMAFCGALCFFSAIFFGVSFFRTEKTSNYAKFKAILAFFSLFLLYYLLELMRNNLIFYFPTPYKDYKFSLLTIASYLPPFMALFFVPSLALNMRIFKEKAWSFVAKWLFALNNLAYLCLIILFAYWGLLNIF